MRYLFLCLLLASCAGNTLNKEQSTAMRKLMVRCELESTDIFKDQDAKLMPKYCECLLGKLASKKVYDEEGIDVAIQKLNFNYKVHTDVSRALMSEDQATIDRFPTDAVLSTGQRVDRCLDTAKAYFYEKEMDERISAKIGE